MEKTLTHNQRIGAWGESLAKEYLLKLGFTFVTANFHAKEGEIDLIFRDGEEWVFVEVKSRSNEKYGMPEEAVTEWKMEKIVAAGSSFLEKQGCPDDDFRIDIVAITFDANKNPHLRYLKYAGEEE